MQTALMPMMLLKGTGLVLVALGFLVYAAIRRLPASYLALGALAWIITVALKFAWAIPLNAPIAGAIATIFQSLPWLGALVLYVYVGSLTGWTEILLTWLALRFTRLGRVPWSKALAFGVGFGAFEALLLGFSNLDYTALNAASLTPAAAAQLQDPLWTIAPIIERFFTVWIHIGACVLIFLAATRRRAGWMWLAFLFKTLIDSVAAYGQIHGVDSLAFLWLLEAAVAAFGIAGWAITRRVQAVYAYLPAPGAAQAAASAGGTVGGAAEVG